MSSRIALITIMLAYCSLHRAVAVSWAANTCPFGIPESTSKDNLKTFAATDATNYTIITQNGSGRFAIASNGTLSSTTELDYESDKKSYSLVIMAFNAASENATLTCEIGVTDVNDKEPLFVQKYYYVETVNNVAINTSLLTVSATDRDVTAEFNKVVYSIKDGGNGENFTIHVVSGVISAKTILAAAGPLNLTLNVVATDKSNNKFTDEASVRVCVGCKTSGSSSQAIGFFACMTLVIIVVLM